MIVQKDEQEERLQQVLQHVTTLMNNIVKQEEEQRANLTSTIQTLKQTLRELQHELGEDEQVSYFICCIILTWRSYLISSRHCWSKKRCLKRPLRGSGLCHKGVYNTDADDITETRRSSGWSL